MHMDLIFEYIIKFVVKNKFYVDTAFECNKKETFITTLRSTDIFVCDIVGISTEYDIWLFRDAKFLNNNRYLRLYINRIIEKTTLIHVLD